MKSFFIKHKLQIICSDDNDDNQIIRIRRIHEKEYVPAISPDFDDHGRIDDAETRREKIEK